MGCQVLLGGKRKKKSDTNSDNNTKRDGRQQTSRVCLFLQFSFTALNSATPPSLQPPRPLIPIRTKEPSPKKGQKKEKCIPIMLVQALQQQNAAFEKDTAGRPSWESPRGPAGVWSATEGGAFYHLYTPPPPPPDPQGNVTHSLKLSGRGRGKKDEAKSRRRKR